MIALSEIKLYPSLTGDGVGELLARLVVVVSGGAIGPLLALPAHLDVEVPPLSGYEGRV